MEVQIIEELKREFNKRTGKKETVGKKINNVQKISFDPIKDDYCISSDKGLRYLFLNKTRFRLSLASYKECRIRNLISGI